MFAEAPTRAIDFQPFHMNFYREALPYDGWHGNTDYNSMHHDI
jgi:hypothetical protein